MESTLKPVPTNFNYISGLQQAQFTTMTSHKNTLHNFPKVSTIYSTATLIWQFLSPPKVIVIEESELYYHASVSFIIDQISFFPPEPVSCHLQSIIPPSHNTHSAEKEW